MRRVAITGIGAVTPVGNDFESTWRGLLDGRSGVRPITTFDTSTFDVKIAGMVEGFALDPELVPRQLRRHLGRAASFGVAAAAEALANAGADAGTYAPHERGVTMGASVGRPELQELVDMFHQLDTSDGTDIPRQAPSTVLARDQNVGVATIAHLADCQGPVTSISTACAAAAHAIGEAFRRVQEGDARLMITGGYDALTSWFDVLGFSLLGALSTEHADHPHRASRPFSEDRAGFVLGEGAVAVVLEEFDSARERGAPILAELAGYGSSMNAYRITDAPADGSGCSSAMTAALRDAGEPAEAISYVASHGTGTHGNDICETAAIKTVYGPHAYELAISSHKSMTGHLTAAAGGVGLIGAVAAIRDGMVHPTINLENPDPKLDLDYVPNTARAMPVRAAMVNAFAFGGTNAALVVREAA
jgi:3-oxoacyl-[acyl-carrier-protein] synthase II